jgi:Flp pilus assembly protein TadG
MSATRADRERGAVLVEFAVVVVLFSLVLFGIISFAILFGYRQTMIQAASEGARAASVVETADNQPLAALAAAQAAMDDSHPSCDADDDGLTCTVSAPFACPNDPDRACRTVRIDHDNAEDSLVPRIPLLGNMIPDDLSAKATIVVPGDPP